MHKYISLQNAAKISAYSQEYLSLRARQGKLKATKIGRNWVTTKAWLQQYLRDAGEYKIQNGVIGKPSTKYVAPPQNLPIEGFKEKVPIILPITQTLRLTGALALVLLFTVAIYNLNLGPKIDSLAQNSPNQVKSFGEGFDRGVRELTLRAPRKANFAVQSMGNGFETGLPTAIASLPGFIAQVNYTIQEFGTNFSYGLASPASVELTAKDYGKWLVDSYRGFDRVLSNGIANDVNAVSERYRNINDAIARGVQTNIEALGNGVSKVGQTAKNGFSVFGNSVSKALGGVKDKFAKKEIPQEATQEPVREVELQEEEVADERSSTSAPASQIVREVVRTERVLDTQELAILKSQVAGILTWRGDIDNLKKITDKIQSSPPNNFAQTAPVYIGSSGVQVAGNVSAGSIGATTAGAQNLGVGLTATIGEANNSASKLTVNADSTFNSQAKHNAAVLVGTSTATNFSISTAGNVETKGTVKVLDSSDATKITLGTDGTITLTGALTVQGGSNISGGNSVLAGLSVTGNTALGDEATDTLSFRANTLELPNSLNIDSNTLYIDASNNRLGLGTTTPSRILDLFGSGPQLRLSQSSTSYTDLSTANTGFFTIDTTTQGIGFLDGVGIGSTYATTTPPADGLIVQGNVGIGTSSPNNRLEVLSTTTPQVRVAYDTSNYFTQSSSNAGAVTFDATGASAGFTFSDATSLSSTLTVTGVVSASSDVTVSGTGGVTLLGNGADITFTGTGNHDITAAGGTLRIGSNTVIGNVLALDNTIDIGTAGTRFDKIYADEVNATTLVGTLTGGNLTAETFSINSDNATADTEDSNLAFERGTSSPNALLTWDSTSDEFDFNSGINLTGTIASATGITITGFTTDIIAGAGESLAIALRDNIADALDIQEGSNNYLNISTANDVTVVTLDTPVAGSTSTTLNLGTAALAKTINIGTNATAANTINIGTGAVANTIAVGSSSATTVSITDDNWSVTAAGLATFGGNVNANGGLDVDDTFVVADGGATLTIADNFWVGLGASAGRIEFDDQTTDEVNILNANVGIGTATPGYNLHIYQGSAAANAAIETDNAGSSSFLDLDAASGDALIRFLTGGVHTWYLGKKDSDDKFYIGDRTIGGGAAIGDGDLVTIDTSGNVGIGTTSPDVKLAVVNTAASTDLSFRMNNTASGGTNFRIKNGFGDNRIDFLLNESAAVTFKVGGYIGIGTMNPQALLQLTKDDSSTNSILTFLNIDRTTTGTAAAGIGQRVSFRTENASGVLNESGRFDVSLVTATSGSEDGIIDLATLLNGTMTEFLTLDADNTGAGQAVAVFNDSSADIDFRIESDGNANMFVVDAGLHSGQGAFGFGAAVTNGFFVSINPTFSGTAVLSVSGTMTETAGASEAIYINPTINTLAGFSATIAQIDGTIVEAGSGNHPRLAGLSISAPTITGGVATVSDAATLYIGAAPTATVSGANYALWVDAGNARFDGDLLIGTTPADAGAVRLPNNNIVTWRNAGNTQNYNLGVDGSNRLSYSGGGNLTNMEVFVNVGGNGNSSIFNAYVESTATGAADPQLRLTVNGGTSYYIGVDNSDVDRFKIGYGTAVGTTHFFEFDPRGPGPTRELMTFIGESATLTFASAADAEFKMFTFSGQTVSYTGNTTVTSLTAWTNFKAPTLAADGIPGALTINKATTIQIAAPIEGTNVALTESSAIRILNTTGAATRQVGIAIEALTAGTGDFGILFVGTSDSAEIGANGDIKHRLDVDNNGSNNFTIEDGTANTIFSVSEAGLSFINDTANANMTTGLTINQGAADNEILALKSSDVAHGATAITETDTFGKLGKVAATGGLSVAGVLQTGTVGLDLNGYSPTADTAKSTSAVGQIVLYGTIFSGTSDANLTASGNIVAIRTRAAGATATEWLVDAEGDTWQNGNITALNGSSNPADTGAVRLPNAGYAYWRNAGNTANFGFGLDSIDKFEFFGPSGSDIVAYVNAGGNGASSIFEARQSSTSTGAADPQMRFTIDAGTSWYAGVDNSFGDSLFIGTGTAVGSSWILRADPRTGTAGLNAVTFDSFVDEQTFDGSATSVYYGFAFNSGTLTLRGLGTTVTSLQSQIQVLPFTIASITNPDTVNKATSLEITAAIEGTNVTLTDTSAIRILNTSGTPTNQYGLYIESLTAGATNNYGIYVNTPSGGSGTNLAAYLAGNVDIQRAASGAEVSLRVYNSSNTASSDAVVRLVNGGTSAGDLKIEMQDSGGPNWAFGVDHSDGGAWVLANNTALGTSNRLRVANSTGDTSILSSTASTSTTTGALVVSGGVGVAGDINVGGQSSVFTYGTAGNVANVVRRHTDNTNAASHAYYQVRVGGASGGDPYFLWTVDSATTWYAGIDNSASDKFIIGDDTVVGTNPRITIDPSTASAGSLVGMEFTGRATSIGANNTLTEYSFASAGTISFTSSTTTSNYSKLGVGSTSLNIGDLNTHTNRIDYIEGGQLTLGTTATTQTYTAASGLLLRAPTTGGANITLTNSRALLVVNQDAKTGTITNQYGIWVDLMTSGASNYGVRIEAASTQTLWVSGNADNTTAAAGIAFGSSRDTNLYRNAANRLATDDAFHLTASYLRLESGSGVQFRGSQPLAGQSTFLGANSDDAGATWEIMDFTNTNGGGADARLRLTLDTGTPQTTFSVEASPLRIGTISSNRNMILFANNTTFLEFNPQTGASGGHTQLSYTPVSGTFSNDVGPTDWIRAIDVAASTITLATATQVTGLASYIRVNSQTMTKSTASATVDKATTLSIAAPIEGTNITLSVASAIRILNTSGAPSQNYGLYVEALSGGTSSNGQIALANGSTAANAVTDVVQTQAIDIAAGDARLAIQAEAGSAMYIGNNRLRFAAAAGYVDVAGTDAMTFTATSISTGADFFGQAGVRIGADSGNNEIDDATQGAASTTLYIGNASINVTSDARVKTEIAPYSGDALGVLSTLQVSSYKYLPGYEPIGGYTGTFVGFTAQDVNNVAPWAVNTQGNSDGTSLLTADDLPWQARFELLNGLIVKGIQQLDSQVASLSAQITVADGTVSMGALKIDTSALGAGNNNALCHLGNGAAGEILGDCPGTPADVAEYYETDGIVQAGDAVSLVPSVDNLPRASLKVKQAVAGDEKLLVGVVSTLPNLAIGELKDAQYPKPVALVGRVPVRVSTANGAIEPGDSLALSDVPGVAVKSTKAGIVIGRAMEAFDGTTKRSQKTEELITYMEEGKTDDRQIDETRQKLQKAIDALNRDFSSDQGLILMYVSIGWQGNDLSVTQTSDGQIANMDPEQLRTGLASLGLAVNINGQLEVDILIATTKVTTPKLEVQRLQLTDQRTGDTYCTWVDNGQLTTVRGECDTIEIAGNANYGTDTNFTSSTTTDTTSEVTFTTDTSATTTITDETSSSSTDTVSPSGDGVTSTTSSSEDGVIAQSP